MRDPRPNRSVATHIPDVAAVVVEVVVLIVIVIVIVIVTVVVGCRLWRVALFVLDGCGALIEDVSAESCLPIGLVLLCSVCQSNCMANSVAVVCA